jgi:hypothetical protein
MRSIFNSIKLKIDRIVLYIDDLDRCNEEIVVKVLEAIHLLLAFPLFIVIVGVDPRWLNNSLNKKMDTLFSVIREPSNEVKSDEAQTNSYDYLEKIFQIPFAIKAISDRSREKLIKYLMRNEMGSDGENKKIQNENVEINDVSELMANAGKNETIRGTITDDDLPEGDMEERIALTFKSWELEFIQRISPLFAKSPRTVNSYINIYRIIRSHRRLVDQTTADDYLPIMFMLAIVVGFNDFAPDFIKYLYIQDPSTKMGRVLEDMNGISPLKSERYKNLENLIRKVVGNEILDKTVAEFKKNLELISRFSFRPISI